MSTLKISKKIGLFSSLIGFIFSACAPSKMQSQAVLEDGKPIIIEQTFQSPTQDFTDLTEEQQNQYESPFKTQSQDGKYIYLGYTKISDIKSSYNRQTKTLKLSGRLAILDSRTKKEALHTNFDLTGTHKAQEPIFSLKPLVAETAGQDIKVRGKVTCLEMESDDTFDCSRAVVDFFIKYKNTYYSEQLVAHQKTLQALKKASDDKASKEQKGAAQGKKATEVKLSPTPPQQQKEVSASSTTQTQAPEQKAKTDDSNHTEPDTQEEGIEDSLQGRFKGTINIVLLDDLFDETQLAPQTVSGTAKASEATAGGTKTSVTATASSTTAANTNSSTSENEETLSAFVKKNKEGRLVKINQAYGYPDKGYLRNSSSLKEQIKSLKHEHLYQLVRPERDRFYGTQEMMDILMALGQKMVDFNEGQGHRLFVGNISAEKGGKLPPHVSHQIGMDVDLGYPTKDGQKMFPVVVERGSTVLKKEAYSSEKTLNVFKYLFSQTLAPVEKIFVDQAIIKDLCHTAKKLGVKNREDLLLTQKVFANISHVDGHGDHYHMRLQCTNNQPGCQSRVYKKVNNCSL